MVIGTFAYCGSGQDTLADSICKFYNYKKYAVGDIIRAISEERGLGKNRDTLRSIRKEFDNKYGREYFPKLLVKTIQNDRSSDVIITGIRTMQEYQIFKKLLDLRLIFVTADEKIRMNRMLRRKDEKDENSIESLTKQMEKEKQLFDYEELKNITDYVFEFNISLQEYLKYEAEIIKDLLNELKVVFYE